MKTYHVVQNNHKAKTGGVKLNILISLVILNFQIIFFMFGNTVRLSAQDTLICDNGGFEDGFDYYFGEVTSFQTGSDNCTPSFGGQPSTWVSSSLPGFHRFSIVSSGTDSLVGIPMTKFGNKALRLNHPYGHNDDCTTDFDVNKIVKRFKVTQTNREFTIWFAIVFENPGVSHQNSQPYFNIHCDLASGGDLCFDANLLSCEQNFSDNCPFDPIDVLNWSCHRISIPEDKIGSIATLEISSSDCGQGCHFGYAYIDGICEECTGSALGSATLYNQPMNNLGQGIDNFSCNGDTLTICGDYTLPYVCGNWILDSFKVFGISTYSYSLDTSTKTFCIDIPSTSLNGNCKDVFVELSFKSVTNYILKATSNKINVCPENYAKYNITVTTGICQNNGTTNQLSDDYYYVKVILANFTNTNWTMERELNDPYPNETGKYIIKTGSGNGTINLGPLLIQEGSWILRINAGYCTYEYNILPPDFCGECSQFNGTKISNITCHDNGTSISSDDKWSFDVFVPGNSGSYTITGYGNYSFGSTHTINVAGNIGQSCIDLLFTYGNQGCDANFVICPPRPCSGSTECLLETFVTEVSCNQASTNYSVKILAQGGSGQLCYQARSHATQNIIAQGNFPSSGILGAFTEDVEIKLFVCNNSDCYELSYITFPDCNNLEFRTAKQSIKLKDKSELIVVPNPIISDQIVILSDLLHTELEVFNCAGILLTKFSFKSNQYHFDFNYTSGVYFIRYKNSKGSYSYLKFIKK
ncbi:MAG: T9SS type A sorting domain-containing protein [Saprospiraceae bacterium]|nr:T9SS type A sorting domain-containing protein [Candidatus Vicinibacter affinis]